MRRINAVPVIILLSVRLCTAQDAFVNNAGQHQIQIKKAAGEVTIDGELNEPAWSTANVVENFWQQDPIDGVRASHFTKALVTYNDKYLYVAGICYDDSLYFVRTLKRDDWGASDEFGVLLDPIGQKALGYGFGSNVLGGETEGIIIAPGEGDGTWDNRWHSAVKRYHDHYIVEIAIPFKTIRFNPEAKRWGIQFIRIDPNKNEIQVWAPVPREFSEFDMGYFGSLVWEEPPARQGGNVSVIPYAKSSVNKFSSSSPAKTKVDFGGDAKIALTSSLNLDLTTNPDFSQVEVDQQVTNLTRFGIFFPERRQFFIENGDIFNGFGTNFGAEQPFYSRRIGLDESGTTVPILYGLRLTGNVNSKLRIGAFNIHSRENLTKNGQNYSAATFQQRIGSRSFINGIFLNRQGFHRAEAITGDYGRNLGGEFEYLTDDGVWQFEAGGLHSMKQGYSSKNNQLYFQTAYIRQRLRTVFEIQHIGENFFADMGFTGRLEQYDPQNNEIVRVGFTQISNMLDYYTYPSESKNINFHWSGLENFVYINTDGTLNEWYTRLRHFFFYKNTSILRFRFNNNYVDLLYPFALTDTPLPAKSYNMMEFNVQYNSDTRKVISGELFGVYGQFFGGTKLTLRGNVTFRQQPWGAFSLGIEQNNIHLTEPYGNLDLTLASARVEINFRKNLFWTTFFQYNTQSNNFNVNSRLQWRFAPVSDLYLVYTDNYRVDPVFGPKDKTLVLKMNYWLSL